MKIVGVILCALVFLNGVVWHAVLAHERGGLLTATFLNVGQGDSIFVESPSGAQVLIDGGPDRSVLRELGKVMPWWDRTIDVVIATHPDADHISGLIDVLQRFRVSHIFEPGVKNDTPQAESMLRAVANEDAVYTFARRGQVIDLGGGAYIQILFPDRDVNDVETNTASIVAQIVYGDTALLLTGDLPESVERYLVQLDGKGLQSTVLKAGHHGSKTSSSLLFVGFVDPDYGVFSRGCNNTYGHPHNEVVEIFKRLEIQVLDTCTEGRVTFISDGTNVTRE